MKPPHAPLELIFDQGPFAADGGPAGPGARPPSLPPPDDLALSPDGSWLAMSFRGRLRFVELATGARHDVVHGPGSWMGVDFHPDGDRLAVASDDGVALVPLCAGGPGRPENIHTCRRGLVHVSNRGERLAVAQEHGIQILELESGARLSSMPPLHLAPRGFLWLADDDSVLLRSGGAVLERDARSGQVVGWWPPVPGGADHLGLLPDGRRVVFGGWNGQVEVIDPRVEGCVGGWSVEGGCLELVVARGVPLVATASESGHVELREVVETGHQDAAAALAGLRLGGVDEPPARIHRLKISHRGEVLVSVAGDGVVRGYRVGRGGA